MKTAKVVFWIGIIVGVVGFIANAYDVMHMVSLNNGAWSTLNIELILSPLGQGALLVAAAKIIELLAQKVRT